MNLMNFLYKIFMGFLHKIFNKKHKHDFGKMPYIRVYDDIIVSTFICNDYFSGAECKAVKREVFEKTSTGSYHMIMDDLKAYIELSKLGLGANK